METRNVTSDPVKVDNSDAKIRRHRRLPCTFQSQSCRAMLSRGAVYCVVQCGSKLTPSTENVSEVLSGCAVCFSVQYWIYWNQISLRILSSVELLRNYGESVFLKRHRQQQFTSTSSSDGSVCLFVCLFFSPFNTEFFETKFRWEFYKVSVTMVRVKAKIKWTVLVFFLFVLFLVSFFVWWYKLRNLNRYLSAVFSIAILPG